MKRLRHWLFNFAAAVSLVLCVAFCILLIDSFFSTESASIEWAPVLGDYRVVGGASDAGRLWMGVGDTAKVERHWYPRVEVNGYSLIWEPVAMIALGEHAWFGLRVEGGGAAAVVPYVVPIMALAVLPAIWYQKRKRIRRVDRHCSLCGYDLRATPEQCPECGTIPAKA